MKRLLLAVLSCYTFSFSDTIVIIGDSIGKGLSLACKLKSKHCISITKVGISLYRFNKTRLSELKNINWNEVACVIVSFGINGTHGNKNGTEKELVELLNSINHSNIVILQHYKSKPKYKQALIELSEKHKFKIFDMDKSDFEFTNDGIHLTLRGYINLLDDVLIQCKY